MKLTRRREEADLRERVQRLERELAERTRELEAKTERLGRVAALAQTVTASLDPQNVFSAVVDGALQLLHVTLARLWVVDPGTGNIDLVATATAPDEPVRLEGAPTSIPRGQGRVGWVIEQRRPRYSPVLADEPIQEMLEWKKLERFVSQLAVPLVRGDQALGALVVNTRQQRHFTPDDEELLVTFAAEAALAIENARLYEETRARLSQTETVLAVSQTIGSTLDVAEVARRTTREIVRALGADMGGAWGPSPGRDRLVPLAGYHATPELIEAYSRMSFDHPLVGELTRVRGLVYSSDSQTDPRFADPLLRPVPHKSVLAVPMWSKDELIGGFGIVWTREAHHFTAEELRLVDGIARQAAIAVENARLLEAEKAVQERLALSETRYRELFENAIDIVYLHDLDGRLLAVNEAAVRATGYARDELLGMNIRVLLTADDAAESASQVRRMIAGERVPRLFTARLGRKDGSRAILECSGRLIYKDGAPVAVQGVARDITVRRNLEERQAAFVEILKELAAEEDLERLFSLIGRRFCELIGADSAVISLVEGDELVFRGSWGFDSPERPAQRRPISESRVGRVVMAKRPFMSSDTAADLHWRDSILVTRFGCRAVLDVPVILRGEVIGVLGVQQKRPRVFSPEDVASAMSLAGHTAIVVDRINLLRELKAQLKETETLLTVSQAVSSTVDPTETMRRVARETALALGADMVGAYLPDAGHEVLHPIAGYHVPKPLLAEFSSYPVPLKGHRVLEEAWGRPGPAWSSDAANDPRVDRETFRRFPHRSNLFFPMVINGQPIGGLFLIWWTRPRRFTEEELRLVEGISRQAAVALDNARLYERQKTILERLRLFAQSVRAIGESVVITDLERRIIFVNETFVKKYGWTEAEVLGQPVSFLPAPSTPSDFLREIDRETRRGGWQGELRHRRKSGEEFPVLLTTTPVLDESGTLVALVGVSRDLSDEKLLAAQLIQAEKLAAVGQLAAGVAHEINNPLTAIVGFSSIALERNPPKEIADDLEMVRAQAIRAAEIVRDLLAFARPSPSDQHPVDLNEALRQTLRLQAYHLATDQIEVVWELTEPLPGTRGDGGQLQQVILNLVVNAHQAMKAAHGRGTLTIATGHDCGEVWVRIGDDGTGIPAELLPRIFDPFLTTKPVGQGTGLGLSISYGIVQAHGGRLLAEHRPGGGATFTIVLPAIDATPDTAGGKVEPAPRRGGSLSVLVVDDEPAVARVLSIMLERMGHRTEVAQSGPEALTKLRQNVYDLMTLDLKMPHMSGQEVWQRLQSMKLPGPPKVLFVTGDIATKGATTFLTESGQPYLEKPFQPSELAQKLDELGI